MTEYEEMLHRIREMGAEFGPSVLGATRALFEEPVRNAPWAELQPVQDLSYGPAERQRLDIYPTTRARAPIVLFVHGGGFVGGDKDSGGVFYGNVGRYFAHHGYLGVCMTYRLAPDSVWPSGSEDVAAALAWLTENAALHGGDPHRIVLIGQSAGAAHVASVIFDARFALPSGVRAAALLSGFYQMKAVIEGGPRLYYGNDPETWHDRSVASHVTADHIPLLLSVAELDPAVIADQTLILADVLNGVDGRPPRLVWFENHNHVSTVLGLGLGSDTPGKTLRAFFEDALAR